MRVLIISDTHGSHETLKKALAAEKQVDLLLHLGDLQGGYRTILSLAPCPVEAVRGNVDLRSDLPDERLLNLCGHRIWMLHGHQKGVSVGLSQLKSAVWKKKADIVLFGHTHTPHLETNGEIIFANPGSLSYPRPMGRRPSYMVMDIETGKKPTFEKRFLMR